MVPLRPRLSPKLLVLMLLFSAVFASAQAADAEPNLNRIYWYPVSFGAGFQPLNPLFDAGGVFNTTEVSGFARLSLPPVPWLGILARGGVIRSDSLDQTNPNQWDHTTYFGGVGAGARSRMTKEFEFGGELFAGAGATLFPALVTTADGTPELTNTVDLLLGGAAKLTLNPTFNLSVDVAPTFRYRHNLGGLLPGYSPLDRFNGFSFGIGIAASYRVGTDPDSPEAIIRALRIAEPQMPPVFAAMQSVYAREPITSVTITNTEDRAVTDLEVAFFQAGFMDTPTPSPRVDELAPGESVEVPILASFNREVFATNGITPLVGEIVATYALDGRAAEQRASVTYDLHDRNALSWDDDRKIAAFITPSDSGIRNYASYIRTSLREQTNEFVPEPLQLAMQTYAALAAQGLLYQVDPSSPFTQAQENPLLVDSVSLPRETISRITGDCDDITVLFNTILESAGVETGFVTIPGHIYSAVNTKLPASDYDLVHPDRSRSLVVDGEVWVLVEITLIGSAGFMEAWDVGQRQWVQYDNQAELRGFYRTKAAQSVYRPVGLTETDLGLQYAERESIRAAFVEEFRKLSDMLIEPLAQTAREADSSRAWNRYGIRAAMLTRYDVARTAFDNAARRDRDSVDPLVNLGSVAYLEGDYGGALHAYQDAVNRIEDGARVRDDVKSTVYLNLAKTAYRLEQYADARDYYSEAEAISPARAAEYAYIGSAQGSSIRDAGEPDGARASDAADGPPILFADEQAP